MIEVVRWNRCACWERYGFDWKYQFTKKGNEACKDEIKQVESIQISDLRNITIMKFNEKRYKKILCILLCIVYNKHKFFLWYLNDSNAMVLNNESEFRSCLLILLR